MFENCQHFCKKAKCSEASEKLIRMFGWKQTYNVEKLNKNLTFYNAEWQGKIINVKSKSFSANVEVNENQKYGVNNVKKDVWENQKIRLQKSCLRLSSDESADSWVTVQSLQTFDGGILDPDDRLNDVVDDREQIVATFSNGDGPHHGVGDGASGSSIGTSSPDIFQSTQGDEKNCHQPSDIEVTGDQLVANTLQVRRGSEPALNQLEGSGRKGESIPEPSISNSANKRWSAAPVISDVDHNKDGTKVEKSKINGYVQSQWSCHEEEEKTLLPQSAFQRDEINRFSMQFLPEEIGLKWIKRASHGRESSSRSSHSSLQRDNKRREPLGQANSFNSLPSKQPDYFFEETNSENLNTKYIVLKNEEGPLGIHVVPDYDAEGKDRGLLVQGIEPGGRVHLDGRLAIFDRIVEINGSNLLNESFHKVQEIFKNSLSSGELRLRVVRHKSLDPRSATRSLSSPIHPAEKKLNDNLVEGQKKALKCTTKVATVSPTKKLLTGATTANILQTANTRKMGKKIDLELLKGPSGLGFSITTRDNPAGGKCPIYIKNILPQGAAVDDGRLKPGDRLLQVNDIEMTGKTQPEAVAILRQIPTGSIVKISVSRQEDVHIKPESLDDKDLCFSKQERIVGECHTTKPVDVISESKNYINDENQGKLENDQHKKLHGNLDEGQIFPWHHKEILTLDIPAYDSEKAGLGVSVKGKTSASHSTSSLNTSNSSVDLGIFVKSVLKGGAASRDGRLKTNDQLLNINGKSLLNQSNANAMETLRRAMLYMEGSKPGVITLTIARRVSSPELKNNSSYLEPFADVEPPSVTPTSTSNQSIASEALNSTAIFLPSHDNTLKSERFNSTLSLGNHKSQKLTSTRNPVIHRLTGQNSNSSNIPNALRNESYYRATHETTWNITNMVKPNNKGNLNSPTVNPVVAEPVLIEEDYSVSPNFFNDRDVTRKLNENPKSCDNKYANSGHSVLAHSDVTYASQLSLNENAAGFSRDGIGRQSMSEKRHATLDAKNTDTYRRNKKMREERREKEIWQPDQGRPKKINNKISEIRQELFETRKSLVRLGSADSIVLSTECRIIENENNGRLDIGPALGMKKSSSLESLQTMVQEVQMAEDPDSPYTYKSAQGAIRVIRGRGCNESFRAAVDRSYDAPLGLRNHIEMSLSEEESYIGNSEIDDFNTINGRTLGQCSLNGVQDTKFKQQNKKKASLLKGIGSMFRFGKHRKAIDVDYQIELEDEEEEESKKHESEEKHRENARIVTQGDYDKIQEQYKKFQFRQNQQDQKDDLDNRSCLEKKFFSKEKEEKEEEEKEKEVGAVANNKNSYFSRSSEGNESSCELSVRRAYSPLNESDGLEEKFSCVADMDEKHNNTVYDVQKDLKTEKQKKFSQENRNFMKQKKENLSDVSLQSRSERIHQLRVKHQKKHIERCGLYPFEDKEEKFEQFIRQNFDDQKTHFHSDKYDIYGETERHGYRTGAIDPTRFSHYVNYEEIQQHLTRKKQHYHSQRRDNREFHQRPVSNFYEYETVQSVIRNYHNSESQRGKNNLGWQNSDSLPRHFEKESKKSDACFLPRKIDKEEFMSSPSVKKTVNYLNKLSSLNSPPVNNYYCGRISKEEEKNLASSRVRGPYISQITIKENPNES